MSTTQRYLAQEIYRSCAIVLLALIGLFTFFAIMDDFDLIGSKLPLWAFFYIQVLALPTRLYDLLPIGLLIGAILALAGLAHRNELIILRVSGMSGLHLMKVLWLTVLPLMLGATLLSEYITPAAEIESGEANLRFRGQTGDGRLSSGYWFKEPTPLGGSRIINVLQLLANSKVQGLTLYEFTKNQRLTSISTAESGQFIQNKLLLNNVVENVIDANAQYALADAQLPLTPSSILVKESQRTLHTTLNTGRLMARVLTPERMSLSMLWDYISYLHSNQISSERQVVAMWRKFAYPFTLLVMMTIAAPIAFIQTRRGGVGIKVLIGILFGVVFFMINQLALNMGTLVHWPPWLTALGPNIVTLFLGLTALIAIEYRYIFYPLRQKLRFRLTKTS